MPQDSKPWRWASADGSPGFTPDEYMRIGRASAALQAAGIDLASDADLDELTAGLHATQEEREALRDAMAEVEDEEQTLAEWASEDPQIRTLLGEMQDFSQASANLQHQALELSNTMTPALASAEAQASSDRIERMLTRTQGRIAYRGGHDFGALAAAMIEAGPPESLVRQFAGGADAFPIELARADGSYPDICGTRDEFGRCSAQYHDMGCSHCVEAEASYGATPKASLAWRNAMQRHADLPLADSRGRVFHDQHGNPMRAIDHVEAQVGERQSEGVWLGDRSQRRDLRRPERILSWGDPDSPETLVPMPAHARRTAAQAISEDGRLQSRRQSAAGRRFSPAEDEAYARKLSHPDWYGETMAMRRERIARTQPPAAVGLSSDYDSDPDDRYSPLSGSLGQIAPR